MGLVESHHISEVVTHPTDRNVVYVASQGHLWAHEGQHGIFSTTDGGATWQHLTPAISNSWPARTAAASGFSATSQRSSS